PPHRLPQHLPVDVPHGHIERAEDDDLPAPTVRVHQGVPHVLPEPLGMRHFLANQQPAEVRLWSADRSLHGGRRDAKNFGESRESLVRVDADAGQRLDASLVRIYLRTVTDDECFEARDFHLENRESPEWCSRSPATTARTEHRSPPPSRIRFSTHNDRRR